MHSRKPLHTQNLIRIRVNSMFRWKENRQKLNGKAEVRKEEVRKTKSRKVGCAKAER